MRRTRPQSARDKLLSVEIEKHVDLEGRHFGCVSTEARVMKLFFLTETSVISVMQLRKGLNQNDTIRLEKL